MLSWLSVSMSVYLHVTEISRKQIQSLNIYRQSLGNNLKGIHFRERSD